jgi:hypothetical protein
VGFPGAAIRWPAVSAVVELGHQPPVGFTGGGEFLIVLLGAAAQVEGFLLESRDLVFQRGDVGRGAEAGALADLGAQQFR